jgi:hypothetical protein
MFWLAAPKGEIEMTKVRLLAAGLIATTMLATPVMARENHVANRQTAVQADPFAPTASYVDGRACIPAPRVGAFATAPWGGNNIPCEPEGYSAAY